MPIITVSTVLRDKLGDEGAEALVSFINDATPDQRTQTVTLVEEKFERRLAEELGALEIRLTTRMANLETRVIRWMFIFWVGQIGALVGILFAFFRS